MPQYLKFFEYTEFLLVVDFLVGFGLLLSHEAFVSLYAVFLASSRYRDDFRSTKI